MLRVVRYVTWGLVGLLGGLVLLTFAGVRLPWSNGGALPLSAAIGGPFALASTKGGTISSANLAGRPFAVFFGYTYCPDVCPTTLQDLSGVIQRLGPDADKMSYVFISVDPERDTIEQLKTYLASFDPRIVGATGTEAQIAEVARKYHAIYEKSGKGAGYTINHTASIYLMDARGQFAGTLDYQEPPDTVVAKLKRLIGTS